MESVTPFVCVKDLFPEVVPELLTKKLNARERFRKIQSQKRTRERKRAAKLKEPRKKTTRKLIIKVKGSKTVKHLKGKRKLWRCFNIQARVGQETNVTWLKREPYKRYTAEQIKKIVSVAVPVYIKGVEEVVQIQFNKNYALDKDAIDTLTTLISDQWKQRALTWIKNKQRVSNCTLPLLYQHKKQQSAATVDELASTRKESAVPTRTSIRPKGQHTFITVSTEKRLCTLLAFIRGLRMTEGKVVIVVATDAAVKFYQELILNIDRKMTRGYFFANAEEGRMALYLRRFSRRRFGTLFCSESTLQKLDRAENYWIVQYDPPSSEEKYLELLKRMSDKQAQCHTLLFLSEPERPFVNYLTSNGIPITSYSPYLKSLNIQDKIERLHKSKYSVYITAKKAYTDFVRLYTSHEREFFKISQLSIKQIGKSFGFLVPPRVNLETVAKQEEANEPPAKKKLRTPKKYMLVTS